MISAKERIFEKFKKDTWELKTLEEISTEIYRGNGVTKEQLGSGNFPAVKNEDISSKLERQFYKCVNFVNPSLIKSPKYFEHGDILISCLGGKKTIGKSCVYLGKDKCIVGNDITIIKHSQNPKYFAHSLSSSHCKQQIERVSQESTVFHLYPKSIKQIKIPLPSLNIQSQIANYLDKFSELIKELKETLIESKKQYNFYLNSLIGRSEEEVRKKYDWEIKSLGEISLEAYTGNGITKLQLNKGSFPAIRYSDVHKFDLFIRSNQGLVNELEIKNKKYCETGDLLFAVVSENLEGTGKSVAYLGKEKCLVGMGSAVVKHNQNPKYLAYVLSSDFCRNQVFKTVQAGTRYNFSINKIKQLKIPLPSLEEQERIVSILDKFHTICEDIEEGVPKLIKDVTKQYEYYRDQIFS